MPARSGPRIASPIVVLGAPRSGTTLLAQVLAAHPDVTALREPRLVWRYGNDRLSDQMRPAHATPDVIDHIHAGFAAAIAGGGGSRVVEKTPANAVRPDFVDAVFPDARYVHITRNGWGAVPSISAFWQRRGTGFDRRQVAKLRRRLREARLSQLRHYAPELLRRVIGRRGGRLPLYGPRLAGLGDVVEELGHLEAAALQWRACVDSASTFGRALPRDRYIEIGLEALTEEVIRAVLDLAGLSQSSDVLEAFRGVYDREIASRRVQLTDAERAVVAPYVLPANAWLGYPGMSDGGTPVDHATEPSP